MKVLVTGATGFLGSHVVDVLLENDCDVRALVRPTSQTRQLEGEGVELMVGSLGEVESLTRAIEGVDALIHCAGGGKVSTIRELYDKNTTTTVNLLTAALPHADHLERFVFISSLSALGPSNSGVTPTPATSDHPISHYGRSKLRAERRLLEAKDDIPLTIFRPPPIYGPGDQRTLLPIVKALKRHLMPLPGPDYRTAMIYVRDCAQAIYRSIVTDHPSGRIYYTEDGQGSYTRREMAQVIAKELGVRGVLKFKIPFKLLGVAAFANEKLADLFNRSTAINRDKIKDLEQKYWLCDASLTRSELEWEPEIGFQQGIRLTLQWYRQQGWIS